MVALRVCVETCYFLQIFFKHRALTICAGKSCVHDPTSSIHTSQGPEYRLVVKKHEFGCIWICDRTLPLQRGFFSPAKGDGNISSCAWLWLVFIYDFVSCIYGVGRQVLRRSKSIEFFWNFATWSSPPRIRCITRTSYEQRRLHISGNNFACLKSLNFQLKTA